MTFMSLETEPAPKGMRKKRFLAFIIDVFMIFIILNVIYGITGKPDFFAVKEAMDKAQAINNPNSEIVNEIFILFNQAYGQVLLIWFGYEVITLLIFKGSTIGKLICGLRLEAQKKSRKTLLQYILLIVRSGLKMLSLYLFQGFPFLICQLTIFTNGYCRSGLDMTVRMQVKMLTKGENHESSSTDTIKA